MLKYLVFGLISISFPLSIPNIANAEIKQNDCNTIKFENNNFSTRVDCKSSQAEVKKFHAIIKEAYIKQNQEGDGLSTLRTKELNLPETTKSEYHYISFREAKNVKIVESNISNGMRNATVEISEIERVYKRTQTYGKSGESHFSYELKAQFISKGIARFYLGSDREWKLNGGLGHV